MSKLERNLPNDEYQAAIGANNPSATNVFATIDDLTSGIADADAVVLDVKINQVGGINKGQAVYVNGANGTNILVGKADYSTEATSSKTLGLLISSGANNDIRKVITQGSLKGTGSEPLDTSTAIAGDPVWLGANGNLIFGLANKPYAPNHLVYLGVVVEAHPIVGEISVKVQNGFELEELHDVDLISNPPIDNDVLTFNQLTGLWENQQTLVNSSDIQGNVLLSGNASWSGTGMTFNVSALRYSIDGTIYSAGPADVTLAVGDPTDPRFDAIVADNTSTISVITGTPSANPLAPAIPGNAILVQYVLVTAGATTPDVTNEFVYREGTSPDWTPLLVAGAAPSLTANFASITPTPFQGGECTLVSAPPYASTKYIQFTKTLGNISRLTYPFLSFRVHLGAAISTRNVLVQLFNGNTALGTTVLATNWGLNPTTAGVWQLVVIPLNSFGSLTITNISRVRFYFTGTTPTPISVAFDDIKFQSGYGPQANTATIDVFDDGTFVGSTTKLNFESSGLVVVSATVDSPNNRININTNVVAIQKAEDEGTVLPQRFIINFVGEGVNVFDDFISGKTVVNIPGNQGNTTYYLNQSVLQTPYSEFSSIKTTGAQVSTPYTVLAGATDTIGEFLTPSGIPGTTNLVGGIWAFYLHITGTFGNSWTIFVEVYKRSSGGTETLLLTTDSVNAINLSATPQMFYVDGVLSGQAVLTTDRILIRVKVTNNDVTNNTINFVTEGNTYYSVSTTTLNQTIPSGAVTSVTGTSPIQSSGGTTPAISISNAVADGTTKGAAAFTANDFNDNGSGVISIDYANGQKATSLQPGFLTAADWIIFNSKQNALTFGNLTESTSSVLTISGGTGSVIGSGTTIQVKQASALQSGFLSSTDWIIFNNKLSQAYQTIEEEGTPLTQRNTINFVGAGVTATDSGGKTVVTIPGAVTPSWEPPDINLSSFPVATIGYTGTVNTASIGRVFPGNSNESIYANLTLDNKGIVYDGSNTKLRISWQMINTIPGATDTVQWRVTYVYVLLGESGNSKTATVVTNTISVGARIQNQLYTDDLNIMTGVANAKLLEIAIARLGAAGGDTYTGDVFLFGIQLIK